MQNEWLARVQRLRRWERDGQRAPHKPLLLLYALGRLQRGETRPLLFSELAGPVADLLREYGPPRRSYHPEFPFHHLTSDGLWRISDQTGRDARPLGTADWDPEFWIAAQSPSYSYRSIWDALAEIAGTEKPGTPSGISSPR